MISPAPQKGADCGSELIPRELETGQGGEAEVDFSADTPAVISGVRARGSMDAQTARECAVGEDVGWEVRWAALERIPGTQVRGGFVRA